MDYEEEQKEARKIIEYAKTKRTNNNMHILKCIDPYYSDVVSGKKTFEIRKNDRDYKVGDILILKQYNSKHNIYTGKEVWCKVIYMVTDPEYCKDCYCVMGIIKGNGNDHYEE